MRYVKRHINVFEIFNGSRKNKICCTDKLSGTKKMLFFQKLLRKYYSRNEELQVLKNIKKNFHYKKMKTFYNDTKQLYNAFYTSSY